VIGLALVCNQSEMKGHGMNRGFVVFGLEWIGLTIWIDILDNLQEEDRKDE
jgi:hypothetical protein